MERFMVAEKITTAEDDWWPSWLPRELLAQGPIETWDPKLRGAFMSRVAFEHRYFAWTWLNARSAKERTRLRRLFPKLAKQQIANEAARWERYWRRDRRSRPTGDIVETSDDLRIQIAAALGEHVLGPWFLHLREVYGQRLAEKRLIFGAALSLRRLRNDSEEVLGALARLRALDRCVLRELKGSYGPSADRSIAIVTRAVGQLATLLGVDAEPPTGKWSESAEEPKPAPHRTPEPDLARRRLKAAPKTSAEKAAERMLKRIGRIVALLRRNENGLSKNQVRTRLKMGRDEVSKALERAIVEGRIERHGSLMDPSYYVRTEVIRKRPRKIETPFK
jgi:hypothetical protein